MICIFCNSNFEPKNRCGGQNRKICYSCMSDLLTKKERQIRTRELLQIKVKNEKLIRGCDICGYNKCSGALDWHHENDDKDFNPSIYATKSIESYQKYLNETKKCKLLCANCHREIHYLDKSY